ncbi:hypothetical protein SEA_SEPHIROTH_91 [Gordonia Phage Sephiroth]|uniref:Uncharacterized protein n=2 Tax=Octobienvirus TaxID=3044779 RepID=A0AAE9C2X6_9CAUD|nr:hypothetical protein L3Y23_gp091 [Gordonia Phage Sephiroth]YP_010246613.1 hypothetical protein L3Y24_gp094 [Gordonia phage Kudefre]QNN99431.1 hypothetical protein SEA_SEPHIROTH_91 [Gordonia Phage Sephiroth]UDL15318.1 hypothetical protein SEA_KUDEFRE_94 [Gordonia phage Kudefre]
MADGSWWALENPGQYSIGAIKHHHIPGETMYHWGSDAIDYLRVPKSLTLIELTNDRTTTALTAHTDPETNESVVLAYGKGKLKELSVYLEQKPDAFSWRKIH